VVIISVLREMNFHMNRRVICLRDFGGKFNNVGSDNIGHCENRNFIWREGYYCGW
jgi:hypothetical protein